MQFLKGLSLHNLYILAKFLRYIILMYSTSRFFIPSSASTYFFFGASYFYRRYCKNCKKKEDYEYILKCVNEEIEKIEVLENKKIKLQIEDKLVNYDIGVDKMKLSNIKPEFVLISQP